VAARSSALALALVGLGGAAGLVLASQTKAPGKGPSDAQLTAIAGEIDARLRATEGTVEARATTISELQTLPYTIGSDEATVRDQTSKEIAFSVKKGQVIELGQVFKDGHQQVLLRLPASMTLAVPLDKPGKHLMVHKDTLMFGEVIQITPKDAQRAAELIGAVAVAQEVPLGDLVDKLDALGTAGRIELDGKPVIVGTRPSVPGATLAQADLTTQLGGDLQVVLKVVGEVLPPTTTRNVGLLGGAAALAVLALGGAALLWRRGLGAGAFAWSFSVVVTSSDPARSAPRMTPTDVRQLGVAHTEMSPSSASVPMVGSSRPTGARLATDAREKSGASAQPGRFGRYKLVKALGAGGMAEVYLATVSGEAGFEKQVALKIMHASLSMQEKVVDLFLDEARIVSRLTHPNIVQISDLGKDGTDYFIAMEYIDGWDLDKLVRAVRARGEQVPLKVGLTILRKICDGLHAAHTAVDVEGKPLELVHRDVKAENVLISRSGAVKVGDFGIAKANQQVHKTQLGELKGTAAYMAPEHRTGQAVDKRADIYGVGAIAYEVLTGNEVNLDLAMLAHLGREGWPHLPAPTSVRTDLPLELDAIVFKALQYEKDARYPTCEAFEEALESVQSRLGLNASDKAVAQWVESVISNAPVASGASTSAPGAVG
jgi:hypothetical protein